MALGLEEPVTSIQHGSGSARKGMIVSVLALAAIVGLSTLLHWLAGRRLHGLWIVPDEAIYAARAVTVWHHGPLPLLHGQGAGYGLLYPVVAGVPLSLGSTATGYAALKVLQALVVSLAALPVYAYGRRLMPARYALVGAALTVASPLLLYSGLVMTEVLFYPLAALALLAIARAVATAALRDQALALLLVAAAVLARTQAVVFVVVFLAAILLDAAFARSPGKLRAFWPTSALCAAAAVAAAALPGAVGAYSGTLRGGYPLAAGLRLSFDHLSLLALSTGVVPAAALVLLTARAVRARERDPAVRAFVAVTVCAVVVLVLQVGFFAARYAPHLLGRDLAALPPLLFLALALWLSRRNARNLVAETVGAFGVLCVLLLAPWNSLAAPQAFADTFGVIILSRLHPRAPVDVVVVVSVVLLAAFVLVPRRAVLALPLLVLAVLIPASVVASNQLAGAVNARQVDELGSTPNWIDRAARGKVVYLYGGEQFWSIVWQERFWNRSIDRTVSIRPAQVPGPMPQTAVTVPRDGHLPITERYVVAPDRFTLIGDPVAHLSQNGLDVSGLTLWRLDGAPRISTIAGGVQPNGDISSPATISVYDCTGGRLELTVLPKATDVLRIRLNGRLVLTQNIAGLSSANVTVDVPSSRRPRLCLFTIVPHPLLGTTRIQFVRG
ncbi:MAG: glycosyltransferase family 39 protein [Gaiellaceae bacterium]